MQILKKLIGLLLKRKPAPVKPETKPVERWEQQTLPLK